MAIFKNQWANVVEWEEYRDDVIFWVWRNKELKKGSRLVIRPGQDAVFLYNGRIEGIFTDEGNYAIESEIIPFLSSLKGFKFGFNSGLRAEVMFVNVKEFAVKWGTKNALNIPAAGMPGGLPIRAFGTFVFKVSDYVALIDKIAGTRPMFAVDDVRDRMTATLDQLLMKHIPLEGRDMFNLQASASDIAAGIKQDLDMELSKLGLSVVDFAVQSFTYPPEVQAKINQNAAYGMVGDVDRYQKIGMVDAATTGKGGAMSDSMGAALGMAAGMKMAQDLTDKKPTGNRFCSECGAALAPKAKFCGECGTAAGNV